jgi:hypothetical protein
MATHTENLTAILDLGRDTLPEGHYLKLANFLKTITKPDEPAINHITVRQLNHSVTFRTYRQPLGAMTKIRMISVTRTMYDRGPNLVTLTYQVNDNEPVTKSTCEFECYGRQLARRYGMRDIQIHTPDLPITVELYHSFAQFKQHITDLDIESDKADHMAMYGDLDNFDPESLPDEYLFGLLFGYSNW